MKGHNGQYWSVCFSPDGQRLATADGLGRRVDVARPGEIKVWDAWSGQELLVLKEYRGPVESVCFSPDGRCLAAGGDNVPGDGFGVRIWDAWSSQGIRILRGHTGDVEGVAFSADGQRLIATDSRGNGKCWDLATGQGVRAEQAPSGGGARTARSPDSRWFALADGPTVWVFKTWEAKDITRSPALAAVDADWHQAESERHERAGEWFAAAFHIGMLMKARPKVARSYYHRLADALGRLPDRAGVQDQLALAYLGARRIADYRRACADALKRATPLSEIGTAIYALQPGPFQAVTRCTAAITLAPSRPWEKVAIARACALRPDRVANPDLLLTLTTEGDEPVTRGAILCRVGRHDEALKLLAQSDEPAALLYHALAELGRGRLDAASAALDQAGKWLKTPDPEDPMQTNAARLSWQRRLEVDLLRGEIRKLLKARKQ